MNTEFHYCSGVVATRGRRHNTSRRGTLVNTNLFSDREGHFCLFSTLLMNAGHHRRVIRTNLKLSDTRVCVRVSRMLRTCQCRRLRTIVLCYVFFWQEKALIIARSDNRHTSELTVDLVRNICFAFFPLSHVCTCFVHLTRSFFLSRK